MARWMSTSRSQFIPYMLLFYYMSPCLLFSNIMRLVMPIRIPSAADALRGLCGLDGARIGHDANLFKQGASFFPKFHKQVKNNMHMFSNCDKQQHMVIFAYDYFVYDYGFEKPGSYPRGGFVSPKQHTALNTRSLAAHKCDTRSLDAQISAMRGLSMPKYA